MDKHSERESSGRKEVAPKGAPRVIKLAGKLQTSKDFANFMSALMSDLVEGKISPNVGNATCNAGGKLLKIVEMEYKYGTKDGRGGNQNKTLTLAVGTDDDDEKSQ